MPILIKYIQHTVLQEGWIKLLLPSFHQMDVIYCKHHQTLINATLNDLFYDRCFDYDVCGTLKDKNMCFKANFANIFNVMYNFLIYII